MNALALATVDTFIDRVTCIDLITLCRSLPPQSVDMIAADLPYGTTACSWDTVIPFAPMWAAFKRIIKPRGAIVLTASQPFTSALVMSNPTWFRYEWVWEKEQGTNFLDAWRKPYKVHESVCVFGEQLPQYFPQFTSGEPYVNGRHRGTEVYGHFNDKQELKTHGRLPRSVMCFDRETGLHPTQKPVALFEYLIRTYTKEGDIVLDPTCGSGTTAVAARACKRRFICGDTDEGYVLVARDRLRLPFEVRHVPQVNDMSGLPLFAGVA